MSKYYLPLLLSGLSFSAAAQNTPDPVGAAEQGPPRWSAGLAAIVSDSPYAGEGTRVQPVPLVTYEGERFYFRGIAAGWRFVQNDSWEVAALLKARFDGFEVKDLGRAELERNGIDHRLLEDRKIALDGGLGVSWAGTAGELELELLADVTDKSGGQQATLQYSYPIPVGKGTLSPNVGITWMSKDTANYYYGTLDSEVARGVVDYRPGAATLPQIGLSYFRPVGRTWSLRASAEYSRLPSSIKNSPLLERDTKGTASVFVGFSRGF